MPGIFLDILAQQNLQQLVDKPAHIHGNTLDLICTNQRAMVHTHDIIYPGPSDHSIVTAEICTNLLPSSTSTKVIKLYHKVDYYKFQPVLERTKRSLAEMSDIDHMWTLFSSDLENAFNDYVPWKTMIFSPKPTPVWFTKESRKIVTKQTRLYSRFRQSGDLVDQQLYTKAYKETKKNPQKDQENLHRTSDL